MKVVRPRKKNCMGRGQTSDQWIVIFPMNRNRNRFAEPTSVRIGIGIVCEFQHLRIGIGIIFVRWEVFSNYSRIPKIFFSQFFVMKDLLGKQSHGKIYAYSLSIFNIIIKYSWILWRIFANRNNVLQITIFANRKNIHEMKLWRIGIGIYSWPKYKRIDSWQIYSQTICELFTNRELFAEHWDKQRNTHTDIATTRPTRPRGPSWWKSKKL